MVLLSADGVSNTAIAKRFRTTVSPVSFWQQRYRAQSLAGLRSDQWSRTKNHDRIAALLRRTLQMRPGNATQCTVRMLSGASTYPSASQSRIRQWPNATVVPALRLRSVDQTPQKAYKTA